MTESPYHRRTSSATSVRAYFEWLGHNWERGVIGPESEAKSKNLELDRCFLPSSKLEEYFGPQTTTLHKTLKAVCPTAVRDDQIGEGTIRRSYLHVFAILLYIEKAETIPDFVVYSGLADNKLPFGRTAPDNFPYKNIPQRDFYEKFFQAQWKFCVEPMRWNRRTELMPQCILPILSRTKLGEGGFATTYRINIHPEYNELRDQDGSSMSKNDPEYNTFVLKTYEETDEDHYENEVSAFLKIRHSHYGPTHTPGFIRFYGSFKQEGIFHIILEWANHGTLEDYFHKETPPRNVSNKYKFWNNMLGLLGALKRIHETRKTEEDELVGWHQDVKPENILVCKPREGSIYDCEFKLADLGLSHFITKKKENPLDMDLHGTLTFGAPECYRPDEFSSRIKITVTPLVDVWSLGCVLSEASTWVAYGLHERHGLDEYRQNRFDETRGIPNHRSHGCFHDGSERLATVTAQHAKLRMEIDPNDMLSKHVLHLSDKMLWHADYRESSSDLHKHAVKMLGAKPPPEQPPGNPVDAGPTLDKGFQNLGLDNTIAHEKKRGTEQQFDVPWPVVLAKEWRRTKRATSNCSQDLKPGWRRELERRDFILIIDDSSTMLQYWDQVVEMVDLLTFVVKDFDSNGLELMFTNDDVKQTSRDAQYLVDLVKRKRPDRSQIPANLNLSLGKTLTKYNSNMRSAKAKTNVVDWTISKISRLVHPVKPSIVYVLTDGLWQPGDEIESCVRNLLETLIGTRCQGNQFGVQFIQFGGEESGTERLRALDLVRCSLDSKKDIVDTESVNGDFRKMLLGSVNRWYDDDPDQQQAVPGSSRSVR